MEKLFHDFMKMSRKSQRDDQMELLVLLFLEPWKLLGAAQHLLNRRTICVQDNRK